MPQDGSKE